MSPQVRSWYVCCCSTEPVAYITQAAAVTNAGGLGVIGGRSRYSVNIYLPNRFSSGVGYTPKVLRQQVGLLYQLLVVTYQTIRV